MKGVVSLEVLIIFLFLAPVAFLLLNATNDFIKAIARGLEKTTILYRDVANIKNANDRLALEGNTTASISLPNDIVTLVFSNNRVTMTVLTTDESASAPLRFPVNASYTLDGRNIRTAVVIFTSKGDRCEVSVG